MSKQSKFDEGYEAGFEAGKTLRLEMIKLEGRYAYLQAGGTWQLEGQPNPYLAGFLDAMKTLGVNP